MIVGAGLMGTAITVPLADNDYSVHLVGTHLDTDIIEEIHETRFHPRLCTYADEVVMPYIYGQLDEAMKFAKEKSGVRWLCSGISLLLECSQKESQER